MTALLLALAGAVLRAVFLAVVLAVAAGAVWVVWDCTAGPSARLAAAHRTREVHGR